MGFGGSYPLFVPSPDVPEHLHANPDVIQRFYPQAPELAIDPIPFLAEKPPDGFRIVVQGGSSAAGFPYGRWGSLAGMLGDRLEATFPERDVEVVSTAMAAVNSYALRDFVDEIQAIEPDTVLIYAGHNEYLGIFGVGSGLASGRLRSLALLRLELGRYRVYQLLRGVVRGGSELAAALRGASGPEGAVLMARAASGPGIPFESELYFLGLAQLEANLGWILERYREAGIPVYVGTLVSNERDLAPFRGGPGKGVAANAWEEASVRLRLATEADDSRAARDALARLFELDPGAADPWFALGRLEERAGDFDAARAAYRAARDRDRLRFRAPGAFNRALRALATRHGARMVEVERNLAEASPEGIIGKAVLSEHVHPNARGYFLLADAFYEALRSDGAIGDWSAAPSREEAERDMPLTALDRILAEHAIRELEAQLPFSDEPREVPFPTPRNDIERLARQRHRDEIAWIDSMNSLLSIHQTAGQTVDAAVVARVAAQAYPTLKAPNYAAGMLLLKAGQPARARRYLERSLRAEPDDAATLEALVRANLALGDRESARRHLAPLQQLAPGRPALRSLENEVALP